ncbi:hypothetical protein [Halomonas sp. 3H]|uniref:hypothetical protein n=1 Tax=Halomonas sp. 3H TaxID=2952527 RepID=UPI0020B8F034|nr:hypothetical protein [Halomonas sp. 3H]
MIEYESKFKEHGVSAQEASIIIQKAGELVDERITYNKFWEGVDLITAGHPSEERDCIEDIALSVIREKREEKRFKEESGLLFRISQQDVLWAISVCRKCAGLGEILKYRHVDGGVCYNCHGSGFLIENSPLSLFPNSEFPAVKNPPMEADLNPYHQVIECHFRARPEKSRWKGPWDYCEGVYNGRDQICKSRNITYGNQKVKAILAVCSSKNDC